MTRKVLLPKRGDDHDEPGPWWAPIQTVKGDRNPYPMVCCPNGHIAGIASHSVDAAGKVTPSLVCPTDGCDYHVHATLDGWPG